VIKLILLPKFYFRRVFSRVPDILYIKDFKVTVPKDLVLTNNVTVAVV
jgi:hypothetical protein